MNPATAWKIALNTLATKTPDNLKQDNALTNEVRQFRLSFYGSATDWNHVELIIYLIYKST